MTITIGRTVHGWYACHFAESVPTMYMHKNGKWYNYAGSKGRFRKLGRLISLLHSKGFRDFQLEKELF